MKTTIIFAHPWHDSFNKAVLDESVNTLDKKSVEYNVIDLNKDNFDPVLNEEELRLYKRGESNDPLVKKYNEYLDETDNIILIFPIWWYDMPAIMRGFFDKVMLKDSSYTEDEQGLHPIRNIKNTLVLTSSSAADDFLVKTAGDPINTMIATTFSCIGFNNITWMNLGGFPANTVEERKAHLEKIAKCIQEKID